MVSLWGSKDGDEQHTDGGSTNEEDNNQQQPRQSREANERTRLLPPRNDGYLDPDDPAVSSHPRTIGNLLISMPNIGQPV